MFVNLEKVLSAVAVMLFALVVSGCQSCQDTPSAPPPAAPKAGAPAGGQDQQAADEQPEEEEVDEDALVLLAEGDPEDGEAPLTVKFMVESLIEDEMDNPQYKWDFGDGSPISSEASPTHTYEKPGNYVATIRIVDAKGQLGWDEVDIEAEEP